MSETQDKDVDGLPEGEEMSVELVEIEPGSGYAVLLSRYPTVDLAFPWICPVEEKDLDRWPGLGDALAAATGGANVAAQAAAAAVDVQGLVKLAPETLASMKSGMVPLTSGGWNLGSLSVNGSIAAQVRWLPAAGTQAVLALSSVAPALALVAAQCQLMSLSRRVKGLANGIEELKEENRKNRRTGLLSKYQEVLNTVDEAIALGFVNRDMYSKVDGMLEGLRVGLDSCIQAVNGHWEKVRAGGLGSPKDSAGEEWDVVCEDICLMVAMREAKYMADALCCMHLRREGETEGDRKRLAVRIRNAEEENGRALEGVQNLLWGLGCRIGLMTDLSAKNASDGKEDGGDGDRLKGLLGEVAEMAGRVGVGFPDFPDYDVKDRVEKAGDGTLKAVRWVLERGERPFEVSLVKELVAGCGADVGRRVREKLGDKGKKAAEWVKSGTDKNARTAVTESPFIVTVTSECVRWGRRRDLENKGVLERRIPLDDVRYVRFVTEGVVSKVDILTVGRDNDLHLSFSGGYSKAAEHIADLLATVMHVPEDEMKEEPYMVEARRELREIEAAQ
ncbi:hypothetical protein [Actinomyces capricornis]|uniref:Uncharacterized protein n=1 Tax=Actinomyces capricornis TaxID=2755559 RepID=A0ABN6K241_9ACTO|nr:hypothetical protein [Actinomyces capricornis]BDA63448.1 hypothetical protein MANAM107_02820 [Actinomyces capricornis]